MNPPVDSVTRVAVCWATGLGVGNIPKGSGTAGALLGLPLAWACQGLGPWTFQLAALAAVLLLSLGAVHVALPALGRGKDPGCVVVDEIATVPITFLLIPMTSVGVVAAGFVLHRLFDIAKPPPVRQLERLPGAWGVMADDVAAGLYSNFALRLLTLLVPTVAV